MSEPKPMTENQQKALNGLLTAGTVLGAARLSGLNERTIRRYLDEPDFTSIYRKARSRLYELTVASLQASSEKAVETLTKHLDSDNPHAAIRAAQLILEGSRAGIETFDLMDRIEGLEKRNETGTTPNPTRKGHDSAVSGWDM